MGSLNRKGKNRQARRRRIAAERRRSGRTYSRHPGSVFSREYASRIRAEARKPLTYQAVTAMIEQASVTS